MKVIVFDAGPIITLTMNNVTWLLKKLNKSYPGKFYIAESIKFELIDKPIESIKFKFEALQTLRYIKSKILNVYNKPIKEETNQIAELINSIFNVRGTNMDIVHLGEAETIAIAIKLNADAVVIDERTMRLLIEDPHNLKKLLQKKLNTKISINKNALSHFQKITKNIKVLRSIELVTRAYELGLLDKFIPDLPNGKKKLLTAILWGVKLDGCSVTPKEIDQIVEIEKLS